MRCKGNQERERLIVTTQLCKRGPLPYLLKLHLGFKYLNLLKILEIFFKQNVNKLIHMGKLYHAYTLLVKPIKKVTHNCL